MLPQDAGEVPPEGNVPTDAGAEKPQDSGLGLPDCCLQTFKVHGKRRDVKRNMWFDKFDSFMLPQDAGEVPPEGNVATDAGAEKPQDSGLGLPDCCLQTFKVHGKRDVKCNM